MNLSIVQNFIAVHTKSIIFNANLKIQSFKTKTLLVQCILNS